LISSLPVSHALRTKVTSLFIRKTFTWRTKSSVKFDVHALGKVGGWTQLWWPGNCGVGHDAIPYATCLLCLLCKSRVLSDFGRIVHFEVISDFSRCIFSDALCILQNKPRILQFSLLFKWKPHASPPNAVECCVQRFGAQVSSSSSG
jgi:hypothetical protein